MLSEPFLQNPTPVSVTVVWFTEFEGTAHWLELGHPVKTKIKAGSQRLDLREDEFSYTVQTYTQLTSRPVWRHAVNVTELQAGHTLPYRVVSQDGEQIQQSDLFTLQASPPAGQPLNILLTSDHQLMPMVAANIQQAAAIYGKFDAVFHAGDLVNVPDRASEWFDDRRGRSFFPVLQGKASVQLGGRIYQGAPILQNTPLFPCIGNHEVMGRHSDSEPLHLQFKNPHPRVVAEARYLSPPETPDHTRPIEALGTDFAQQWITDHSFNYQAYQNIFSLPPTPAPQQQYYAVTFGNIRLIALMVTNVWRSPEDNPQTAGRYQESEGQLTQPEMWGYGQFIFEPITPDSQQYQWLQTELAGLEFQQAKYKIVMFHHPPHSLGRNVIPPYTDPRADEDYAPDGSIRHRRYHYPKEDNYIIKHLLPLLETAGVQLVICGHSHLWNRFQSPGGMHYLETSNVGNSYGAHIGDNPRKLPAFVDVENDCPLGNPNGLEPIVPIIAPLLADDGRPLPYIASNEITVFSVLETATGTVKSYYYQTRQADVQAILFDQFCLTS
ncbi:MAG: hypothetical protein RLZZ568_1233 [Cyanobacteriota bacterium]|jgi:hypothetical protein